MERRSFLKLLAVTPAIAAAPSLVFAEKHEPIKTGVRHIGNVIETIEYDIGWDRHIVDYRIRCGTITDETSDSYIVLMDKEYAVTQDFHKASDLPDARKRALEKITADMKADNIDPRTLVAVDKLGDHVRVSKPARFEPYKMRI